MPNAYATAALMLTTYGPQLYDLLDLAQNDGTYSSNTRLLQAIDTANSQVDSSLLNRYILPLSTVPGKVKAVACELARWELLKARPDIEGSKDKDRKDEAEAWLRAISVGTLRLEVGAGETMVGGAVCAPIEPDSETSTATSPTWVADF